jgi:hypothetical protein
MDFYGPVEAMDKLEEIMPAYSGRGQIRQVMGLTTVRPANAWAVLDYNNQCYGPAGEVPLDEARYMNFFSSQEEAQEYIPPRTALENVSTGVFEVILDRNDEWLPYREVGVEDRGLPDLPILNEPDLRLGQAEEPGCIYYALRDELVGKYLPAMRVWEEPIYVEDLFLCSAHIFDHYLAGTTGWATINADKWADKLGHQVTAVAVKLNIGRGVYEEIDRPSLPDLPILNEPDLRFGQVGRLYYVVHIPGRGYYAEVEPGRGFVSEYERAIRFDNPRYALEVARSINPDHDRSVVRKHYTSGRVDQAHGWAIKGMAGDIVGLYWKRIDVGTSSWRTDLNQATFFVLWKSEGQSFVDRYNELSVDENKCALVEVIEDVDGLWKEVDPTSSSPMPDLPILNEPDLRFGESKSLEVANAVSS